MAGENRGKITQVIGAVLDVRFDEGKLPEINEAIRIPLENGKVSGQENPLALIDSSRFYEVQKYCTIINYQFFPELMYVNLDWWKKLPDEYQKILTSCANAMMEENARITDAENEAYIKHIQSEGCQVITLTQAQRVAFRPYAERVWEKYVDDGYATKQELKDMLAIVGKTIKW